MRLEQLMEKNEYNTDKGIVRLQIYENFFSSFQGKDISLLELGVFHGGSLRLWRDYFPFGTIVGLDKRECYVPDLSGRIKIYQGEQDDHVVLDEIIKKHGPFDIIIDDASHIGDLTYKSLCILWPSIKSGGLYVIEDWGTAYRSNWPDGREYGGHVHTHGMGNVIHYLVDCVEVGVVCKPKDLFLAPAIAIARKA